MQIKDAGIKELEKFRDAASSPIAKNIWSSTISFFKAYGSVKTEKELKDLKDKHLKKHSEYTIEYNNFLKEMKEKEGKGAIARYFSKRAASIKNALATYYKAAINYWKL